MSGLTPRDRDVVALVARGLPNKEIGYRLGRSESGVKTTVSRALAATGTDSRLALALWWREQHATPEPYRAAEGSTLQAQVQRFGLFHRCVACLGPIWPWQRRGWYVNESSTFRWWHARRPCSGVVAP